MNKLIAGSQITPKKWGSFKRLLLYTKALPLNVHDNRKNKTTHCNSLLLLLWQFMLARTGCFLSFTNTISMMARTSTVFSVRAINTNITFLGLFR